MGKLLLLSALLLAANGFAAIVYPRGLVGAWEFDNASDLVHADTGNDLVLVGSHTAVTGPEAGNGAVRIGVGSHYSCTHDIAANGGGTRVNNYTLLVDFKLPPIGSYYAFFQTETANTSDADCWINKVGSVGMTATGYSEEKLVAGEWYRLVVSVALNCHYDYYIDGNLIKAGGIQSLDGRLSLDPASGGNEVLFFADNNSEDNTLDVAKIALFDRDLNAGEIAELGGYEHVPVGGTSMSPYLQQPTPSSITINWHETQSAESVVNYGTTTALGQTATGDTQSLAPDTLWHRVQLTGLEPDTQYFYRCSSGTAESEINTFRTFPSDTVSQGHFRVGVIGDTRTYPADHKAVINAMLEKVETLYGTDVQNQLNLVFNVGDIVTTGSILSEYVEHYFEPIQGLSTNVPFMVSIGNHEADDANYFNYMNYEDFGGPQGEKYYSFRAGPIFFLAINSNTAYRNQTQLDWIEAELLAAQGDASIDWVIAFFHHPGHSEIWHGGNTAWVNDSVIPLLANYDKVCGAYYGHTHVYEMGAHPDAPFHLMLSGGGGAELNYWGELENQTDYPEIYKTWRHHGYTILDFDLANRSYTAKTYSLGNPVVDVKGIPGKPLDNVLINEFYQKRETSAPKTPQGLSPVAESDLPPILVASPYAGAEEIMSSHFQLTSISSDYSAPIVDKRRDWINIYGETGAPDFEMIDLNDGIDLTRLVVDSGMSNGNTYFWRVRYRDQNLVWSEWSAEQSFTVNNETLVLDDTFDSGLGVATNDMNYNRAGRQTGLLAPDGTYLNATNYLSQLTANGEFSTGFKFDPVVPQWEYMNANLALSRE